MGGPLALSSSVARPLSLAQLPLIATIALVAVAG